MLAPSPFTNLRQIKIRPVLVVADVRDGTERDWIVCEIASGRAVHARKVAKIPEGLQTGQLLRLNRPARPERLTALNECVFQRTIARLNDSKTAEILVAIRSFF